MENRLITLAIHTFDKAIALKALLESEGIAVELHNVNLEVPGFSSGVRVRIHEQDLPSALRIVENRELYSEEKPDDHTILVPVDFSEMSYRAVAVAARFAKRSNASLRLLYSYLDPYISGTVQLKDKLNYDDGEPRARAMMKANAEQLLKNFRERVRAAMKRGEIAPAPMSTIVMEGVPEDSIIEHGKALKPKFVVMGTRGAKRKKSEMIGSITAEVLDQGRFMVLTVPEPLENIDNIKFKNILFLSNLDQDDILAMDAAYRLLGGKDVQVTIMHVPQRKRLGETGAGKSLQSLANYCEQNFENYHFVNVPVNAENGDETFKKLHKERNFDLIVAPNRRRNAFSRFFNPGLTHQLIFHADVPMLIIPV